MLTQAIFLFARARVCVCCCVMLRCLNGGGDDVDDDDHLVWGRRWMGCFFDRRGAKPNPTKSAQHIHTLDIIYIMLSNMYAYTLRNVRCGMGYFCVSASVCGFSHFMLCTVKPSIRLARRNIISKHQTQNQAYRRKRTRASQSRQFCVSFFWRPLIASTCRRLGRVFKIYSTRFRALY